MSALLLIEKIRQTLISWNVAPLAVVVFLCWLTSRLVDALLGMKCETDAAVYIALSGLVATMGGLIYKLYDSMQNDRKKNDSGN